MLLNLRRPASAIALLVGLIGCSPHLAVPDEAELSCSSSESCPNGWVCNTNLNLCVKADGLDTSAPSLTGPANPSPGILPRAGKSVLALDSSEPLLGVPTVLLGTTPARPFTFEPATSSGQHYEFSYVAAGDEPTDVDVPVSIRFIDLSGNVATATRSLRFDFLPPAANAIAITGSPATSGATVRVTFTASEPLQAEPVVDLAGGAALVADHSVTPPNYAYQYVATGSEPAAVQATIHLTDRAGNTADVPLPSALAFDTAPPALVGPAEIVTPVVRESFTALVRLTVSEPLAQDPQVVLDPGNGGTPIPLTVGAKVGSAYTLEHRVTAADPDGVYTVRLGSLEDLAHNTLAGQTLGTIAIDKVAPALTGSVGFDKAQPLYKAGDTVSLQFDATEALASPPLVQLSSDTSADAPFACTGTGNHFTCTRAIAGSEPEGPLGITIQLEDQAGNIGFGTSSLVLDFTPPFPVGGNVQLLPGATNLLKQVSAVGAGTTVQATFSMSEPVSGMPLVAATRPSALAFTAQAAPGYLFTFQCDGGQPEGSYDLKVTATDLAGNTSTTTLSDPAFTIDETRPSIPAVAVVDKVVYHRSPFGTSATAGAPDFWVELQPNSVAPDTTVIIYDGADAGVAKELGRASPPAGQAVTTVPLDVSDHNAVYALTVDGAGNRASQAVQVKDVEWVASLGGKVPGSTYENPTTLVLAPNLLPSLDQSPIGAAEPTSGELGQLATVDTLGLTASAKAVWREQIPARPSPGARSNSALALDPVRGKLVLFGAGPGGIPGNDTWELDLRSRTWTERSPVTASPPPRANHALVGSGDGIVYLFGGTTGSSVFNDVWAWDGTNATWTQLATKGTAPAPRQYTQAAIDSDRNKLVVFGGDVGGIQNDLWELDLATLQWTNRTPSPLPPSWPSPRYGGLLSYVPSLHALLLVSDNGGTAETWELDPVTATWTARPAPPWGTEPYLQGAFDRLRGALYVLDASTGASAQHLYRYDPGTPAWTDVTAASIPTPWPRERQGAAAAADPLHGGVIFFGGTGGGFVDSDTWLLNSATEQFSEWTPTAVAPSARWGAASAFDSNRGRLMVFGGRTASAAETNELWEWDPSGGAWTNRTPASIPAGWAPKRVGAGMAYDPYRAMMLMFGGSITGTAVNYLDELDPVSGSWISVTLSGTTPTARVNPVVVFDPLPAPGKLYLLGGSTALGGSTGVAEFDVCTFSGIATASCSTLPLNVSGAPTVFSELTGALGVNPTSGTRRLVVFGGQNTSGVQNQELHEFDGTNWLTRPKTGSWPSTRSRSALAFSSRRNKFLLFGGYQAGTGLLADLWEWDSTSGTFTAIPTGATQPLARDRAVLGFSPAEETFALFGGALATNGSLASDETWELSLPSTGRPGAVWTVPFAIAGAGPQATVRSITATVNAAGTGSAASGAPLNGSAMSIWSSIAEGWIQVGTNGSPALNVSVPMTFNTTDPTTLAAMLTGPQQTVAIAATPVGFSQTGRALPTVLLDYLELSVRYRLP